MSDANVLLQIGRNMNLVYGEIMELKTTIAQPSSVPITQQQHQQQQQQHQHQINNSLTTPPRTYSDHVMSPEINNEISDFYKSQLNPDQINTPVIVDNPTNTKISKKNQEKMKKKKPQKGDLNEASQRKLEMVNKIFSQMS